MRLDKLTIKAQDAVQDAQHIAQESAQQQIEPEHLLLALLRQEGGIVAPILQKLGADPNTLAVRLAGEIEKMPKITGVAAGAQISPRLQRVMENAFQEAERLKDEYVSTEHLLIGIAAERGSAGKLLESAAQTATQYTRRWRIYAAASASPTRTPRTNISRWSATAATSPKRPERVSSTP